MAYSTKNLLDIILKDDNTEKGGIPHNEYSSWEFIRDTGVVPNYRILTHEELDTLNKSLKENGILPLVSKYYDIEIVKSRDGFVRLRYCNESTIDWNFRDELL